MQLRHHGFISGDGTGQQVPLISFSRHTLRLDMSCLLSGVSFSSGMSLSKRARRKSFISAEIEYVIRLPCLLSLTRSAFLRLCSWWEILDCSIFKINTSSHTQRSLSVRRSRILTRVASESALKYSRYLSILLPSPI